MPDSVCSASDLVILNFFGYCHWQIGERALCPPELRAQWIKEITQPNEISELLGKLNVEQLQSKPITTEQHKESKKKEEEEATTEAEKEEKVSETPKPKPKKKVLVDYSNCAVVVCTHTFVDVCWQDHTISKNVPSTSLFPAGNLLEYDYWPEDFVVEKGNKGDTYGVIKRMNAADRTCIVQWKKESTGEDMREEEETTVYALEGHSDWNYRLSDVVIKLPQSGEEKKDPKDPSWVGEIIAIENGQLKVFWADKTISYILPNQVLKIDTEEDEEEDDFDSYDEHEYPIQLRNQLT